MAIAAVGITNRQLGQATGIAPETIGRIRTGQSAGAMKTIGVLRDHLVSRGCRFERDGAAHGVWYTPPDKA